MRRCAIPVLLLVGACGVKGPLQWPDGTPPAPPPGVEAPISTEAMLEPPAEAAPDRVDDPVKRSQERREDDFDLPPTSR